MRPYVSDVAYRRTTPQVAAAGMQDAAEKGIRF
jgi:hypothetical protein